MKILRAGFCGLFVVCHCLLMCLLVSCSVTGTTYDMCQLASSQAIPGKLVKGACWEYAVSLAKNLKALGVHARVIVFDWSYPGRSGTHAFVEFSGYGQKWVVDNLHAYPIRVPLNASTMDDINAIEDGDGKYVINKIDSE